MLKRDLQGRYGSPTFNSEFYSIAGKTPLTDIDYQKTARNSVVGELSRYSLICNMEDLNQQKKLFYNIFIVYVAFYIFFPV